MNLTYQTGQLYCEQVPLAAIANEVGTPAYIYSRKCVEKNAMAYQALIPPGGLVCFALKANGNLELLRILAALGIGADVTSGGELFLAGEAGIPPEKTVFSGVGKTLSEINMALNRGIKAIHAESVTELDMIALAAQEQGKPASIALRVNPDIAVQTHPYIGTGKKGDKFGLPATEALALIQKAAQNPFLRPVGLAVHIGSQITQIKPYRAAVDILLELAAETVAMGVKLEYLDGGGGLGIAYDDESTPSIAEWVTAVTVPIQQAGYQAVVEPGRSIIGTAGCLLTAVILTKEQGGKKFIVVDAGMHTLIRPTLYQAYHPVLPVQQALSTVTADIVGPVCESGDWLARERRLPALKSGDLLAITHAGAYGFAMSSNYNGRLRPVEILVDQDQSRIIRPRQTWADLL